MVIEFSTSHERTYLWNSAIFHSRIGWLEPSQVYIMVNYVSPTFRLEALLQLILEFPPCGYAALTHLSYSWARHLLLLAYGWRFQLSFGQIRCLIFWLGPWKTLHLHRLLLRRWSAWLSRPSSISCGAVCSPLSYRRPFSASTSSIGYERSASLLSLLADSFCSAIERTSTWRLFDHCDISLNLMSLVLEHLQSLWKFVLFSSVFVFLRTCDVLLPMTILSEFSGLHYCWAISLSCKSISPLDWVHGACCRELVSFGAS